MTRIALVLVSLMVATLVLAPAGPVGFAAATHPQPVSPFCLVSTEPPTGVFEALCALHQCLSAAHGKIAVIRECL